MTILELYTLTGFQIADLLTLMHELDPGFA